LYAPLLVVQQVSAARLLEASDLAPVRRFAVIMGLAMSALAAAVAFTSLGVFVLESGVGVHDSILDQAISAMTVLWPVPLLTGVRALHQGRLVAGHRTNPIAAATGVRTVVLAAVAFSLTQTPAGAWLGGAAFTAGLMFEAGIVALVPASKPVVAERPPKE